MRYAALFLVVALGTPLVVGQPPPTQGLTKDGGTVAPPVPQAERRAVPSHPAPAPSPALRFELLPPTRDKVRGNAAVGYLRASVLRPAWPKEPGPARQQSQRLDQWEEAPFERLPAKDVAEFLKAYRDMFRAAEDGARCDRCDWQQGHRQGDIGGLLESVQGNREIARYLSLRAKLALAENRPADAVRDIQVGLQLGKHVGEGGTLIQMLVGQAITMVMVGRAEDVLRHPQGPNLYWALTTLPRPFIDPRPSLDGEAKLNASFIPGLRELEAGPVSDAKANEAYQEALELLGGATEGSGNLADVIGKIGLAAGLAAQAAQARKDLAARGWADKDLAAMPNAQAVLLRASALHREAWDDQLKLFFLPYPAATDEAARIKKRTDAVKKANPTDPLIAVFSMIYPAVGKVHYSHARVERRLAHLRAVEAVRLHAALNDGTLPKALNEVTAVPVPDDPLTGKAFEYKADGDTFTLSAPAPKGETPNPANALDYVVTVRKKK